MAGYKLEGSVPNEPKFVIIVVPHTSNWDFPLGIGVLFSIGFRVSFLAKHSVFRFPLGILMQWLGGLPVERSVSKDRVAATVDVFNSLDQLILVIAPEGTRKRVTKWRTGFYHVAQGARIPIVPVRFDFGRKTVKFGEPFWPTGDIEADFPVLKDFFRGAIAKNPGNFEL